MTSTVYDKAFFDKGRTGMQRSAAILVPLLLEHCRPRTVCDVGCGEGWWGREFQDRGCKVVGLENFVAEADCQIDLIRCDLNDTFVCVEPVDLAVCLEVAEHLEPDRSEGFVADICQIAPLVLWSAAIPGQGGEGHINEQPHTYWDDLFSQRRFRASRRLRDRLREEYAVEWWYRQNVTVYARYPECFPGLFA